VGATLYPIAASCWPSERAVFERTFQQGLNGVMVLSGLLFSTTVAGAPFLLGLLGQELVSGGSPVLRVLAFLCFVKAVTSTLGPLLYVVNAQGRALRFIAVAVVAKLAILFVLAPRFGALGVAAGAGAVELVFATVPSIYLVRKLTGARPSWAVPLRVAGVSLVATLAALSAAPSSPFLAFAAAPALYVPLALGIGAVRVEDLRRLLRKGER
jgi:O-antigen/teichoic acid export membrane protein